MPQDTPKEQMNTPLEHGADIRLQQGNPNLLSIEVVRALQLVRDAYKTEKEKPREQVWIEYLLLVGPNLNLLRQQAQGNEQLSETPGNIVSLEKKREQSVQAFDPNQFILPDEAEMGRPA